MKWLLFVLSGITALAHIFIGHFDTLLPLLQADISAVIKITFHACWHMVSLLLIWSVYRFWKGGRIAFQLGVIWLFSGAAFIIAAWLDSGLPGLIVAPQWIVLMPTGLVAIVINWRAGLKLS